ncbi:hypothetical protein KR018_001734 [Drosophila ironensis]|nr:hypothetical protein KR018_001734 [Drosophila ironensis]
MDLETVMRQMYADSADLPVMMSSPNGIGYGMPMPMPGPFHPFPFAGALNGERHRAAPAEEEEDEDDEDLRTVFCGNLDQRVTEEMLYEVFLQAGPIESLRIPTDDTGRQRNFGFVTYQHLSAVPFALELLHGLELFEKKVTMKQQGADRLRQHSQQQHHQNRLQHHQNRRDVSVRDLPQPRHSGHRHSLHNAKPYDRNNGHQNDYRRRSDSSVMERNWSRNQQHHHHHQGGNRRSDQRHHYQRRL